LCYWGGGKHTQGKKLDITSHYGHLSGTLSCIGNRPVVMDRGAQAIIELPEVMEGVYKFRSNFMIISGTEVLVCL
jgi:hypothetical protein